MIITDKAAAKIAALGAGLRIELRPGGCCGTHYHFALSPDEPGLLVTPDAAAILQGATLDYGAKLKPPRFRILRNPNTKGKCPCGRSFGTPYPGRPSPTCQAYCPMPWDQEP